MDASQEPVLTSDGSFTLFHPATGENYHSLHGAITESMHVFIQYGLLTIQSPEINILELGFGTGLNCLLTLRNKAKNQTINYTGIDAFPPDNQILSRMQYCSPESALYPEECAILSSEWNMRHKIKDDFYLEKRMTDILLLEFPQNTNLVYFDAFSPNVQPELWSEKVFESLYSCMKQGAILTTYCSKGIVKQALRNVGFTVHRLPGPPGKRHVLSALKR